MADQVGKDDIECFDGSLSPWVGDTVVCVQAGCANRDGTQGCELEQGKEYSVVAIRQYEVEYLVLEGLKDSWEAGRFQPTKDPVDRYAKE